MAATYLTAGTGTFAAISDGGTRSFTIDAGTASNRVMYALAMWYRNTNRMTGVSSLAYNGVNMSSLGAAQEVGTSEMFVELYRLTAPASGSNSLVMTPTWGGGGSSTDCNVLWYVAQDADQTTPEGGYVTNQGTATGVPTTSLTVTSATDDLVVSFHFNASSDVSYSVASTSSITARSNSFGVGAYGMGWVVGDMAGAAPNVAPSVNWTTGMGGAATNEWVALGVSVNPVAAAGPLLRPYFFL